MTITWSLLVALWLGLQIWYWTALRTVMVLFDRQAALSEANQIRWQEWLRIDRLHISWWQPIVSSAIVFPARAITLLALCSIQLLIVSTCSPFRKRRASASRRSNGLQIVWRRNFVRSIITAMTWAELRCLGLTRTEEYEVLNSNFDDIGVEEAERKIRTRQLDRVDCNALDEPRNYVANHVSFVDIVLFIALLYPSFCSKASVASMPMVGETAKWLDCIFMPISDPAGRKRVLEKIQLRQTRVWRASTCFRNLENDQLLRLVEYRRSLTDEAKRNDSSSETAQSSSGDTRCTTSNDEDSAHRTQLEIKFDDDISYENTPALLVFPEGTTSNGQYLLPFKRGAFAALKPVTPIVLVYDCPWFNMSYEIVPIVWLFPLLAGCWQGSSARIYWLREMCPTVEQVVTRNVSAYTQSVREAMGKVLLAVSINKPKVIDGSLNERWKGDLRTKQECIKHLYT